MVPRYARAGPIKNSYISCKVAGMLRTGPHYGGPPRRSVAHVLSGRKTMRTASLTVLALVAAFLFSVLPAQAAMDHAPAPPTIRIAPSFPA